MRRAAIALMLLVWASLATSVAQSTVGAADYYNLAVSPFSTDRVRLKMVVPAALPNPSRPVEAVLHCSVRDVVPHFAQSDRDFRAFLDFVGSRQDIEAVDGRFTVRDISVECGDDMLHITGPTFADVRGVLKGTPFNEGILGTDNGLSLRIASGYRYPNLRLEPWRFDLLLDLRGSEVRAAVERSGPSGRQYSPVVVVVKSGGMVPVLFERHSTPVQFDPDEPLLIAVHRGRTPEQGWDYLEVNLSGGALTWWRSDEAPSP